jgi:polynucleotide 5'-hydroxyl-kinase GRC3/NOL9
VTPPRTLPSRKLSTFALEPRRVLQDDENTLELSMSAGETAVFAGEYVLEVIKGTATIYGGAFHGSSGPQKTYAPTVQALPPITARRSPTVIRLSSVKSTLKRMEKLSPLFRNIWTADSKSRSFAFLETTADDPSQRSLNLLETDSSTQKVFTQLTGKVEEKKGLLCAMTVGPKSSGKSTFNRQLCNALLTTKLPSKRCLYLDLDPGQPEFGPPGQISLVEVTKPILGPSFTNQASEASQTNKLLSYHTIAATTFKDDPDHYLACIRELAICLESRKREKGVAPIIINACGWTTGLGAAVLTDLYDILPITDTICIEGVDATLMQTTQSRSQNSYTLPRAPSRNTVRSPAELRSMQTMAYFHSKALSKSSAPKPAQWSSKPLNTLRPWIVRYSGPDPGIFATMSYGQSVPVDFLPEILDGALVAIVTAENTEDLHQAFVTSLTAPPEPSHTPAPQSLPYIAPPPAGYLRALDPRFASCAGLALVRGINAKTQELHLVTPLSEAQVQALSSKKVLLVRGGFDAPEWAYLEDLYASGSKGDGDSEAKVRPWVTKKEMVGIEGAVWRLRHPPTAAQINGGGR